MKNKKTSDAFWFQLIFSFVVLALYVVDKQYLGLPIFVASIVSICILIISLFKQIKLVEFYSLAIIAAGGVISNEEQFLAPSIVVFGLAATGAIITARFGKTSSGSDSESQMKMEEILEAVKMSENAKRVLFRDRELNLLRRTVQEDLTRREFHSALVLCDQMANVFGAVEEAEELRTKVQETIHEHHEQRIKSEVGQLQTLLENNRWVEAYQLASKLRRLFPESPLLHGVEQHIADVRTEYRHGLEERFLDAAKQENVELAMNLLRELDGYLTPDEARKFRDAATAVITTYRDSLSARFKMAISDHRWQEAIEFGIEITKQFPNTKMAEEVQSMLETIRVRADEDETTL